MLPEVMRGELLSGAPGAAAATWQRQLLAAPSAGIVLISAQLPTRTFVRHCAGYRMSMPVMVAPMAMHGLAHPAKEVGGRGCISQCHTPLSITAVVCIVVLQLPLNPLFFGSAGGHGPGCCSCWCPHGERQPQPLCTNPERSCYTGHHSTSCTVKMGTLLWFGYNCPCPCAHMGSCSRVHTADFLHTHWQRLHAMHTAAILHTCLSCP